MPMHRNFCSLALIALGSKDMTFSDLRASHEQFYGPPISGDQVPLLYKEIFAVYHLKSKLQRSQCYNFLLINTELIFSVCTVLSKCKTPKWYLYSGHGDIFDRIFTLGTKSILLHLTLLLGHFPLGDSLLWSRVENNWTNFVSRKLYFFTNISLPPLTKKANSGVSEVSKMFLTFQYYDFSCNNG